MFGERKTSPDADGTYLNEVKPPQIYIVSRDGKLFVYVDFETQSTDIYNADWRKLRLRGGKKNELKGLNWSRNSR